MISFKHLGQCLIFSFCLISQGLNADNQIPNLEADLDEQSLSNPSYIIGQYWFRKLNGSQNLIQFPPAYEYLRDALSKILPYTGLYQKNIEIGLLNSSKSNAFVLPGNHLFIYSDMLSKIKDEQTFFALLAHEIAHLDLKHYERQNQHNEKEQNKAILMMGAGIAAALAGAQSDASYALFLSGIANKEENRLAYSRIQEQEADRQARKYLIQANMNENATTDLFLTFFQSTIGKEPIEFLSTHPIPENRLSDSINTKVPQSILKQKRQTAFQQFRATMLAFRASFLQDHNSYISSQLSNPENQNYARALVAYIKNDKKTALKLSKNLDITLDNQAYLKAKILISYKYTGAAKHIINEKLNLNKDQLAYLELDPELSNGLLHHFETRKLLQYEKDIINRIHLKQAMTDKNLALTRAYQAKIAFSKGRTSKALTLLKKAEPLAETSDMKVITKIKNQINNTIELERGNNIKQE